MRSSSGITCSQERQVAVVPECGQSAGQSSAGLPQTGDPDVASVAAALGTAGAACVVAASLDTTD